MYHIIFITLFYNGQKLGKKSRCLKRKGMVKIIKVTGKNVDEIVNS